MTEDGEKDEKAIAIEKLINPVTQWQVVDSSVDFDAHGPCFLCASL